MAGWNTWECMHIFNFMEYQSRRICISGFVLQHVYLPQLKLVFAIDIGA